MPRNSQFLRDYPDRGEWRAPNELYNALDREYEFRDPYANGPDDRGCYYVEPLSDKRGEYLEQAVRVVNESGSTCVAFLPGHTDSEWWHKYVLTWAAEIIFIRGRVPLVDENGRKGSSPVGPSVVVIFKPGVRPESYPRMRSMKKLRGGVYYLPKAHGRARDAKSEI